MWNRNFVLLLVVQEGFQMIVTEKRFCIFCMTWFCWHWGLLLFGFLPEPYRHPVLMGALALDGVMFLTFFLLLFTKLDEIKQNRWRKVC